MSQNNYYIVSSLPHVEKVYVISKDTSVLGDSLLFVAKISGSSFLYPEPYYWLTLREYLEVRFQSLKEGTCLEIIEQLWEICLSLDIQPISLIESGLTFDSQRTRFAYIKQLIGISPSTPFVTNNAFLIVQAAVIRTLDNVLNEQAKARIMVIISLILSQDIDKSRIQRLLEHMKSQNELVVQFQNKPLQKGGELEKMQCDESELSKDKGKTSVNKGKRSNEKKRTIEILDQNEMIRERDIIEMKKTNINNSVILRFLRDESYSEELDDVYISELYRLANIYKKVGNHKLAKELYLLYKRLSTEHDSLFDRDIPLQINVKISSEKIDEYISNLVSFHVIENELTICKCPQLSAEWHSQRKKRVTASNYGNIMKASTNERKNRCMYDMLYPKFFGNAATRYGNETESIARDKYLEIKKSENYRVEEFGLIVDSEFPWIAGSPDGLVYQGNQRIGCIEIKCPFSIKDESIHLNWKNTEFLELNCNSMNTSCELQLKRSHKYFAQCQGIMHLSKSTWCDFIVYTKIDCVVIRVLYDETYVKDMVSKLNEFVFQHLIVEIIQPSPSQHVLHKMLDDEQLIIIKSKGYKFDRIPFPNSPHLSQLTTDSFTEPCEVFDTTQPLD